MDLSLIFCSPRNGQFGKFQTASISTTEMNNSSILRVMSYCQRARREFVSQKLLIRVQSKQKDSHERRVFHCRSLLEGYTLPLNGRQVRRRVSLASWKFSIKTRPAHTLTLVAMLETSQTIFNSIDNSINSTKESKDILGDLTGC